MCMIVSQHGEINSYTKDKNAIDGIYIIVKGSTTFEVKSYTVVSFVKLFVLISLFCFTGSIQQGELFHHW